MFFRSESGLGGRAKANPNSSLPGSFALNVSLIGPLWAPEFFKNITDRAVEKTVKYGKELIQSRTPVDTGNLQSKWMANESQIINEEYYANFVEYGTIFMDGRFMMTDSTKEIETFFIRAIRDETVKTAGTKLGFFRK